MSLTSVKMTEEVWLTCITHALSTETEEIMGLLLGDIQHSRSGSVTALIWGALPQPRSDRRKDRVETNPEQLTAASVQAERMTLSTGRTTRVIGWYHSHPHITVLPSHVDVRTQAMYQLLDSGFIGLIFSCFSEDAQKVGRIQVTAFQSSDGRQSNILGPVTLSPVPTSSVIDIESSLSTSNRSLSRSGSARGDLEEDTADSRTSSAVYRIGGTLADLGGLFPNADARAGESNRTNNISSAIVDIDPMDMSDAMQEAMHRSNLEMSGADFVRKEIPLYLLPSQYLFNLSAPLTSLVDLQRVLFEEERTAYVQSVEQNMRDGKVHPLTYIHHTSTYQATICKLMEYCLSPAVNAVQLQLKENEMRLKFLADESKILEADISQRNNLNSSSPRSVSSHGVRGSTPAVHRDLYKPAELSNSRSVAGTGSRSRKTS